MAKTHFKIALALVTCGALTLGAQTVAEAATTTATVGTAKRVLTGININRATNALVLYGPSRGTSTRTNQFGFEATIVKGKITKIADYIGNAAIPAGGFFLSGHGTSRTWLKANAKVGVTVSIPGYINPPTTPPPPAEGTPLYPDFGVRTLNGFLIANPTSGQFAGRKLLKFPGVTANIGAGPFEVNSTRSSSSSTDWVAKQKIWYSNGATQEIPSGMSFYYAGDGHTHWHMTDFDGYNLYDETGTMLKTGEKHGFCFDDNTSYRDWPGNHAGSPAVGPYSPQTSCGVGQPNATSIKHGLSVGWADTYPTSLPDQAIDITGRPDGTYKVEVFTDQGNWLKESNENNNKSWAVITISGNTVTVGSTGGGV